MDVPSSRLPHEIGMRRRSIPAPIESKSRGRARKRSLSTAETGDETEPKHSCLRPWRPSGPQPSRLRQKGHSNMMEAFPTSLATQISPHGRARTGEYFLGGIRHASEPTRPGQRTGGPRGRALPRVVGRPPTLDPNAARKKSRARCVVYALGTTQHSGQET